MHADVCSLHINILPAMVGDCDDITRCYILAFATIMLNTGLHNPAVKNKQTLESFMKQVSGINDGFVRSARITVHLPA